MALAFQSLKLMTTLRKSSGQLILMKNPSSGPFHGKLYVHRMRRLNCLGLKCAISCCILSAWGIIQLGTMGVLFHTRSIAFLDDVPEATTDLARNVSLFLARVDDGYNANALNCWIGASFYCTFLVFSLCQCAVNYWEIQSEKSKSAAGGVC